MAVQLFASMLAVRVGVPQVQLRQDAVGAVHAAMLQEVDPFTTAGQVEVSSPVA